MLSILANRTYRHLFAAQVIALLGTGLATVALALLAFELAGKEAGAVFGTALAIKMVAYVGIAPFAAAVTSRLPRRAALVSLDLIRAGIALFLPFVTDIWQIYVLIFALQSASAAFTPTFQATIPDILPDQDDYTKALSLSRLAYDLENLISPILAAALLTLISFHFLFAGTAIGFVLSAALVLTVTLPAITSVSGESFWQRSIRGINIYFATPRLRGLLAINMAVAAVGAMVIVNTVVYVQGLFGLSERQTALAMAAFGGGSMLVALTLPNLLHRITDRLAMLAGAILLALSMLAIAALQSFAWLIAVWFVAGLGYSLAQIPSGRLLRRSAHKSDRPAIFAAHFALSHACWLITYPLAGRFGTLMGLPVTAVLLAGIAGLVTVVAMRLWPADESETIEHVHPELSPDHPHLQKGGQLAAKRHRHAYVIDELHPHWPTYQ
jgi:MFS family permease